MSEVARRRQKSRASSTSSKKNNATPRASLHKPARPFNRFAATACRVTRSAHTARIATPTAFVPSADTTHDTHAALSRPKKKNKKKNQTKPNQTKLKVCVQILTEDKNGFKGSSVRRHTRRRRGAAGGGGGGGGGWCSRRRIRGGALRVRLHHRRSDVDVGSLEVVRRRRRRADGWVCWGVLGMCGVTLTRSTGLQSNEDPRGDPLQSFCGQDIYIQ
jgi:hypothetical protein